MKASSPEREVKLAVGAGFRLPSFADLADGVSAGPERENRIETIYYDTQDLRLARWGLSLRYRKGEGWTLKLPGTSKEQLLEREELTFSGSARTPPAAALGLVRAYVRGAPVKPVAWLSTLRRRVTIEGADGVQLAEVVDDEVSVLEGRRVASRFREVEVELREGGESVLPILMERLHSAGAFPGDGVPKYLRALGPAAQEEPEVAATTLPDSPTAADVLRQAISRAVTTILRHDIGVRAGEDPESVHQARVGTRRLRSHLRTFKPLLQEEWSEGLRGELGWLGQELGAVRDAEVLLERLRAEVARLPQEDSRPATALLRRLADTVEAARKELLTAMSSQRYVDLLDHLVEAAAQPAVTEEASLPAAEVLPGLARKPWRSLRKGVRALPNAPADAELHRIRILAKRARYAAEAAAPVVGKDAARFADAAADLQTVLGEHQDSAVAQGWLRANAGSGRRAFVAGELSAQEAQRAAAARSRWSRDWRRLNRKKLRAWLKPA
jgi:CHAD domain-containing protein